MDQPNVNANASTTELFTRAVETSIHKELNLKTFISVEWEADNKTRASRGLNPNVTAVVENSLAGER